MRGLQELHGIILVKLRLLLGPLPKDQRVRSELDLRVGLTAVGANHRAKQDKPGARVDVKVERGDSLPAETAGGVEPDRDLKVQVGDIRALPAIDVAADRSL